MVALDIVSVSA